MRRNLLIAINLLYDICWAGSSSGLIRTLSEVKRAFPGVTIYQLDCQVKEIHKIDRDMNNPNPNDEFVLKRSGKLYLVKYLREFNLFDKTSCTLHLHHTTPSNTAAAKDYLDANFSETDMVGEIMEGLIDDEPVQVVDDPQVQVIEDQLPVNWDEVRMMFQYEPLLLFLRINGENCADSLEMIGQKNNDLLDNCSTVEISDLELQEDGFYIISLSNAFYVIEKEGNAFYLWNNNGNRADLKTGNLYAYKNYGFSDDILEWFNCNIRDQLEKFNDDSQSEQNEEYSVDLSEVIFGRSFKMYSFVGNDLNQIMIDIASKQNVIQKHTHGARYSLIIKGDDSIFIIETNPDSKKNLVRFISDTKWERHHIDRLDESTAITLSYSCRNAGLGPDLLKSIHAQVQAFKNLKMISNVQCVQLPPPPLCTVSDLIATFEGAQVWILKNPEMCSKISATYKPVDEAVFLLKFNDKMYLLKFFNGQFCLFWQRLKPVPLTKTHKKRNYTYEALEYSKALKLGNVADTPSKTNTWEQICSAIGPRSFMICLEVKPDADLDSIFTKGPTFFDACKKVSFGDLQVKDGIYIIALCGVFYVLGIRHANFYLRSSNFIGYVPFNKDNLNDFVNYGLPTQDCNWFLTVLKQQNTPEEHVLLDEDLKLYKHLEGIFGLNFEIYSFVRDEINAQNALGIYDGRRKYHLIRTHDGSMFVLEVSIDGILLVKTDLHGSIQKHNIAFIDDSNARWIYDNFLNGGLDENWLQSQVNGVIKMYLELMLKLAICALKA